MSNPVAALISVPFQFNWDRDIGTNRDGSRTTLNIQPVIPVSISQDWNQPIQVLAGPRYYADSPPGGLHGWGFAQP